MKNVKIIHSGDIHFDEANKEAALKSLNELVKVGKQEQVDLFAIAGDLFNSAVVNNDVLDILVDVIQQLLEIAPIVAVKGTPTHDVGDCYAILRRIKAMHEFRLLETAAPYFLTQCGHISQGSPYSTDDRLLIIGCPEPSKNWFFRDKRMGREEANQEIIEGMRGILLGCGALRKQYPYIPCLFVYHGAVVGASMCNGQKMRPGEIEIGRDDLAFVDAGYYALGHIHLAQSVDARKDELTTLAAYYSGSAYPCNWGETDQKSFNLVEFEENKFKCLKQIQFPHPPRKKIVINCKDDNGVIDCSGFQTWLEIQGTKQELSSFDDSNIEKLLYSFGALPGSRVTTSPIAIETVRAAEITEKKALTDKFQVWGDSSGNKISDAVKEKASRLEAEAKQQGEVSDGAWIRLDKLRLRGAFGINDALKLKEIEIDFSSFDEGLVCLQGETGSGKTTILENSQPFLQMLTRTGKLQDHFILKDSYRDLYFTDCRTETEYRAYIMIDGANKSGKCEPILYKKIKGEGKYAPITNGRSSDYEQKIKQIFGSLNIFLRSAFAAQDQASRIDKCTKGEKKELFRELAGLDYLKVYAERAGEEAKKSEKRISDHQADVRAIEPGCLKYEDEKKLYLSRQEELQTKKQCLKDIEASGKDLKDALLGYEAECKEQALIEERIKGLKKQISEITAEIIISNGNIEKLIQTQISRQENENKLKECETLKAQLEEKNNELIKSNAKYVDENKKYLEAKKEYEGNLRDLNTKIDDARFNLRKSKIDYESTEKDIERFTEQLNDKVKCPKCNHEFILDKNKSSIITIETAIAGARDNLQFIKSELDKKEKELVFLMHTKESFSPAPKEPEPSIDDEFLKTEIFSLKSKVDAVNISFLREQIQAARDAEAKIKGFEENIKKLTEQCSNLDLQIKVETEKLNPEIKECYELVKIDYEKAVDNYRECSKEIAALEATIKAFGDKLHELANQIMKLNHIKELLAEEQQELAEWSLLERACGADGIQALELDSLAPSISSEVNNLLETAFGSRFKVEIRTTREAGKGAKTHQVEDFQIWIHDERPNADKLLENMSGGEKVLITRTICDAFGIINDRNTGTRYLTYFMDEADDGLDPGMRQHYFRIMEAAHGSAHRHQTIVITHSRDIQQMIQQKVIMSELKEAENA